MKRFQQFFLFCAGVNSKILHRTPVDTNKYAAIGATIFFTGTFASIAGGFAIHSVFGSVGIALIFGLLWGLMIFNLDRYIVMSIQKNNRPFKEFFMATPRLVLAILIAFVIAKPLELQLFRSEINAELVLMEQEKYKDQEDALRTRYLPEINRIKSEIQALEININEKENTRDQLMAMAIQEADGTGGSGQKNLGPIYKAKKRDADLAQQELDVLKTSLTPEIDRRTTQLADLEYKMNTAQESMKRSQLDGFAAQLDALGRLSDKSNTIFWASLFITLLFIAIETAPLFVKLISSRSPYDLKLAEHEFLYEQHYQKSVSKAQIQNEHQLRFDKEMIKSEMLETLNAEKIVLKEVISKEVEKMKDGAMTWAEYKKVGRYFG